MRAAELRHMSEDELRGEIGKLKREQLNLRFQQAEGETAGLARMRAARRDVARAMTVLAEKRRAGAEEA